MDFWPHDVRISEEDARRQLAESVTRLRRVRDELNT